MTDSTTTRTLSGTGPGPTLADLDRFLDALGYVGNPDAVTVVVAGEGALPFEPGHTWSISVPAS